MFLTLEAKHVQGTPVNNKLLKPNQKVRTKPMVYSYIACVAYIAIG